MRAAPASTTSEPSPSMSSAGALRAAIRPRGVPIAMASSSVISHRSVSSRRRRAIARFGSIDSTRAPEAMRAPSVLASSVDAGDELAGDGDGRSVVGGGGGDELIDSGDSCSSPVGSSPGGGARNPGTSARSDGLDITGHLSHGALGAAGGWVGGWGRGLFHPPGDELAAALAAWPPPGHPTVGGGELGRGLPPAPGASRAHFQPSGRRHGAMILVGRCSGN